MPPDMGVKGQPETVFVRIAEIWGEIDFLINSISFSPEGQKAKIKVRFIP
jgi:enoyl-[acyl-carrier protein] reductase I